MEKETPKKRKRDVAHLWADKRVIRFFRKNFEKGEYKNLRSVYLALCEIDSDFHEGTEIKSFVQTVAAYSGMNRGTINKYLIALKKAKIIDYKQKNDNGFGGTILSLFLWEEGREEWVISQIISEILPPHVSWKTRKRENPLAGKPASGKTSVYKNNILSIYKNPKGENIFLRTTKPNQTSSHEEKKKPSPKERNKSYLPFSNKLASIVQSNKNIKIDQSKINLWNDEIRKLVEGSGVDTVRLEKALDWYSYNIGGPYIPVIESGSALRNKFTKLEDAMKRAGAYDKKTTSAIPSPKSMIKKKMGGLANSFEKECYVKAKNLFDGIETKEMKGKLAEALIQLYDEICKIQSKVSSGVLSLLPGPISIISSYLDWIEENNWINHKNLKTLEINGPLFSSFRKEEAKKDNLERDPLTGKSKMK